MVWPTVATIEVYRRARWQVLGTVTLLGSLREGVRARTRFDYAIDYAIDYVAEVGLEDDAAPHEAATVACPVSFEPYDFDSWPPFLLDLVPQGTWREVLVTGFFGGTDIAIGVVAYLAVLNATHQPLLAGLAFSVGFLALLLGRSELFTEGFLIPVTTVVAKRASVAQLLKLWSGTLVANLAGGWILMALIMTALPALHGQTIESAEHFATAPLSWETFALSLLGGMVITLMTRMQQGTDAMVGKIAAAVAERGD